MAISKNLRFDRYIFWYIWVFSGGFVSGCIVGESVVVNVSFSNENPDPINETPKPIAYGIWEPDSRKRKYFASSVFSGSRVLG